MEVGKQAESPDKTEVLQVGRLASTRERVFSVAVLLLWNTLTTETQMAPPLHAFQRHVKMGAAPESF